MAVAKVELPDGRIATIEIPDGMSMEEASTELQSMYDTTPEAFQGAPAQEAAPMEEPGTMDKIEEFASKYIPHYGVPKGIVENLKGTPSESNLSQYGSGVTSGVKSAGRGARQLWNQLTGDDEELAQLNEQEAVARQQEEAMAPDMAGSAGRLVGGLAPAAIGGAAVAPAGGLAAGLGLGGRVLGGAGMGALGGAAQPLTTEEQQSGVRGVNAGVGAGAGAAAPIVGAGAGKIAQLLRRTSVDDALQDFAGKQLGATHGRGASTAYREATDAIEGKYKDLRGELGQAYDTVEASVKSPVKLTNSSSLGKEALSLPEEVANGLSPTAKRVSESLSRGATRTSDILDEAGKPIQQARDVSFKDVRETIRELRAAKRALPYTDAGMQQSKRIDNITDRLSKDLEDWASTSDEAAEALKSAKAVDARYADEVAPFSSKESPIGSFRRGKEDEAGFDKSFLKLDKGQATADLLRRVPEAKESVRELYGHKLLNPQGPTLKGRTLEGGTLAESVLTQQEREYLKTVATALKDSHRGGGISPTVERIIRDLGAGKLDTMMHGVEKYGASKKESSIISDLLRSYSAGAMATEE